MDMPHWFRGRQSLLAGLLVVLVLAGLAVPLFGRGQPTFDNPYATGETLELDRDVDWWEALPAPLTPVRVLADDQIDDAPAVAVYTLGETRPEPIGEGWTARTWASLTFGNLSDLLAGLDVAPHLVEFLRYDWGYPPSTPAWPLGLSDGRTGLTSIVHADTLQTPFGPVRTFAYDAEPVARAVPDDGPLPESTDLEAWREILATDLTAMGVPHRSYAFDARPFVDDERAAVSVQLWPVVPPVSSTDGNPSRLVDLPWQADTIVYVGSPDGPTPTVVSFHAAAFVHDARPSYADGTVHYLEQDRAAVPASEWVAAADAHGSLDQLVVVDLTDVDASAKFVVPSLCGLVSDATMGTFADGTLTDAYLPFTQVADHETAADACTWVGPTDAAGETPSVFAVLSEAGTAPIGDLPRLIEEAGGVVAVPDAARLPEGVEVFGQAVNGYVSVQALWVGQGLSLTVHFTDPAREATTYLDEAVDVTIDLLAQYDDPTVNPELGHTMRRWAADRTGLQPGLYSG